MRVYESIIRLVVTVLMVGWAMQSISAQSIRELGKGREVPDYVRLVGDTAKLSDFAISDSAFYTISRGVTFPVNQFTLNRQDPFIVELRERVLPWARERGLILAGIDIRGAASPEGSYEGNTVLAQRRAQSIIEFLTSELGQEASDLTLSNSKPEDYERLLMLMRQAGDADADKVEALMMRHGDNVKALKVALQGADRGALWQRMLVTYFPQLRTAKLVIYVRKRKQLQMVPIRRVALGMPERVYSSEIAALQYGSCGDDYGMGEGEVIERKHRLSVSTNLLLDGFYMPNYGWAPSPNVELEYYPSDACHWTYLAAFTSPYYHRWSEHKFFQVRDYHLEARRYFRPGDWHKGAFIAADLNANIYGIGFSKRKGWEGEGAGAALKLGQVWRLSRSGRWRIELSAAAGGYLTRFDPYVFGNPLTGAEDGKYYYDYTGQIKDFRERNHQRVWIGPTEVALKLRYDLLFKRVQKRGVSTKRKEVAR